MDILKEALDTLWEFNAVRSESDFSRLWLGKSRSYYAMLKSAGKQPSLSALLTLHEEVTSLSNQVAKNHVLTFSPSLKRMRDELDTLARSVWHAIRFRSRPRRYNA